MKTRFLIVCVATCCAFGDTTQQTPLIDAVKANNLARVKEIVASGKANFNERHDKNSKEHWLADLQPLEIAAYEGHLPIVEVLVKAGADINSNEGAPLLSAVMHNHAPVAEFLIRAGAIIKGQNLATTTLPFVAGFTSTKLLPAFKLLLESRKFDAKELSEALIQAAPHREVLTDEGEVDASFDALVPIELLLKHGADPKYKDSEGETALMSFPNVRVAERLLKAGAEINASDSGGQTALMRAAQGSPALVEMLLKAGADATMKDANGNTALGWAAYHGNDQKKAQIEKLLTQAMQKKK